MKKSKILFGVFAVLFIAIISVVCVGIVVPPKSAPAGNSSPTTLDKNYENLKQEENTGNGSTNQPDDGEKDDVAGEVQMKELSYFINSSSVKKLKEITGETTVFNLNFKLFVTNDTGSLKTILTNGFSANYNIGTAGSLYTLTCNENEKSFVIENGESIDLDFTLKYIITKNDEFSGNQKYNLVVNYMLKEVLSLNV